MYRIPFSRPATVALRPVKVILLLIIVAPALAGCSMTMPSFGSSSHENHASSSDRRYAMGVPPAAYGTPKPAHRHTGGHGRSRGSNGNQRRSWAWNDRRRGTTRIIVQRGETLTDIGSWRRVSVSELMAANRLRDQRIRPGQRLLVPTSRRASERARDGRNYQQQRADRQQGQSRYPRYLDPPSDLPVRTLRPDQYEQNYYGQRPQPRLFERSRSGLGAGGNPGGLRHGNFAEQPDGGTQEAAADSYATAGTYEVQPGDTLYSIARGSGISVRQLQQANQISNPSGLPVGMILTIPR